MNSLWRAKKIGGDEGEVAAITKFYIKPGLGIGVTAAMRAYLPRFFSLSNILKKAIHCDLKYKNQWFVTIITLI